MAKPSITKRNTKAAALTYSELDTNFQNLADATLTLRAGTGGTNVTADLNGTITLVAGTNVTLTGDNSAKTITVKSSGGLTNPLTADLNLNGFNISSGGVGNCRIDDDLFFTGGDGPVGNGNLRLRASASGGCEVNIATHFVISQVVDAGGLVLGRFSTANRNLLTGVVNGMIIYNLSTDKFQGYSAGAWVDLH
jgi:hypothetical protein